MKLLICCKNKSTALREVPMVGDVDVVRCSSCEGGVGPLSPQIGDDAGQKCPLTRSYRPHLANVLPWVCTPQTPTSPANQFKAKLNHPSRHQRLHLPRLVPLDERYYSPQTSPVCPAFRTRRECCRHPLIALPLPRLSLTCLPMTYPYLYHL